MLVFNCTKAAAEFFSVTRNGKKESRLQAPPEVDITERGSLDAPYAQWVVHATSIKRKKVLVVMHVHTRYALVFNGLPKGDWKAFLTVFMQRLFNNMQYFGEEFELCDDDSLQEMLNAFFAIHPRTVFCQRSDRSVQSHINDVVWHFGNAVNDVGRLPNNDEEGSVFDEWVNGILRSTKAQPDYFYPDEDMFIEWITLYGGMAVEEQDSVRVYFQQKRKERFSHLTDDAKVDAIKAAVDAVKAELLAEKPAPDNLIDLSRARAKKQK